MITQRNAGFLASAFLLAALAACGSSPPSRFYTLDSTAKSDGLPTVSYAIAVGPVTIPATVDRPQFVVTASPNRVELDEFERWAGPLDDSIARAVAGNLAVLLGTPRVATASAREIAPNYIVTIDVQRFESLPHEAVIVEAFWSVRNTANGQGQSGRSATREAVQGGSYDALAAAHSIAIGKLSAEIAAGIRADAAKKP